MRPYHPTQIEEARLKKSAARLSIVAAGFLILMKMATGWLTGSISVWASLLDSAMDIFASSLNYFAIRTSARPPDEDHLYGHGKVESLAGLFQALVITISGLFVIWEATRRIIRPPEMSHEWLGIGTMFVAAAVSLTLVRHLRRVGSATESPAITADAAHYASDVYTNFAALAALLITTLTSWNLADPIISILISAYILWSAISVARDAVDVLMDRRLPVEVDETVAEIVKRHRPEGVIGFHDLRTRRSGSYKFIDLHLEVRRTQTLEEAHAVTVRVLRAIEAEVPRARVQIHTDPADENKDD